MAASAHLARVCSVRYGYVSVLSFNRETCALGTVTAAQCQWGVPVCVLLATFCAPPDPLLVVRWLAVDAMIVLARRTGTTTVRWRVHLIGDHCHFGRSYPRLSPVDDLGVPGCVALRARGNRHRHGQIAGGGNTRLVQLARALTCILRPCGARRSVRFLVLLPEHLSAHHRRLPAFFEARPHRQSQARLWQPAVRITINRNTCERRRTRAH